MTCYKCNGELTTKAENLGYDENPKVEITIICKECGREQCREAVAEGGGRSQGSACPH